jgi:hypothetical protein
MRRRVSAVMPAGKGPVSMFAFKVLAGTPRMQRRSVHCDRMHTADAKAFQANHALEAKHALRSRAHAFGKGRVCKYMLPRMRKCMQTWNKACRSLSMVWLKSSWGVRAQCREQGQHGDRRGHAASYAALSQVPERRIRHTPNTHRAARTARAYRDSSLVSAVMNVGKVAAANGLLPSDLMGRPPPMILGDH